MQNNNKDEASRQEAHHQIDFGYQMVDEDKKADQVREVFDSVAPKYDLLNDVLSLGLHRVWKSRCINATETKQGQKVLDIASGTCDLAIALARRAGAGNVVATDINHEMLAIGAQRLLQAGFPCPVVEADAEMLPFADNTFDVVTVSFGIRNMTHKDRALREMLRVLRPGGRLLVPALVQADLRLLFLPLHALGGRRHRRRPRVLPLSCGVHSHAPRPADFCRHDDGCGL